MFRFRVRVVLILVFGGFLMVSTRLFYLQVIRGRHYRDYAENVRFDHHSTEGSRGRICAAGGELLAFDAASFNVALVPSALPEWRSLCGPVLTLYQLGRNERLVGVREVTIQVRGGEGGRDYEVTFELAATFLRQRGTDLRESEETGTAHVVVPASARALIDQVAALAGQGAADLWREFFDGLGLVGRTWRRPGDPCVVARDVDFRAAAEIEAHPDRYPGVCIVASAKRSYPYEALACHVIGYMQRVTAGEYSSGGESYGGSRAKRLLPDDLIGRAGIERSLDVDLRPARGEQTVEVDAARHTLNVLEDAPAVSGADAYLTLDVDAQRAAEEALKGQIGSIVLLEPATGRILAMASSPGYDNNEMPHHAPDPEDRLAPLLNRAIQGQYPLGSAFKLLLAVAALEEGRTFREITCTGSYRGSECHNHSIPLTVNLHDAIKRSCNVYFYRTGEELLGIDALAKWATRLGFGQLTGVGLPAEKSGLMPTPAWKRRQLHEAWYGGDTRNLAIGQGYLLVTPLQVARFVAAIANGGRLVRPRIVDKLVGAEGMPQPASDAADAGVLRLTPEKVAEVQRAMHAVCHEVGGTGWRAWSDRRTATPWIEEQGYAVAGKTSTADCWLRGQKSNVGWFVGFAPYGDPRVVFVVALEHEASHLHGADVAAPVARQVLSRLPERYLKGVPGRELREQFRERVALEGRASQ